MASDRPPNAVDAERIVSLPSDETEFLGCSIAKMTY